jgi:hypothetical protein
MFNFFLNNFKKLILLSLLCIHEFAFASGNFFDITFNGSFQSSFTTNYKYTKTSYGIELGIPLSSFFEINIGESFATSKYIYTDEYKAYLTSKGISLPTGDLTQEYLTTSTYGNISIGLFGYYLSPSIYGGVMNSQTRYKDFFGVETSKQENLSWDAGAALSIRLSRYLKFKINYRISPSNINTASGAPLYDQSYTGGLTISL